MMRCHIHTTYMFLHMSAVDKHGVGSLKSERDVTLPALQALNESVSGELSTTDLRQEVRARIVLSEEDLRPLAGRNDQRIDQIIRNLKSHKAQEGNPIALGLIDDVPRGFRITDAGRRAVERRQ